MKYLELEELVVGKKYVCVLYDSPTDEVVITYVGENDFEDDEYIYSTKGDVRYVLREADTPCNN